MAVMKKDILKLLSIVGVFTLTVFLVGCSSNYNSIGDPHFTEEGELVTDSTTEKPFKITNPSQVTFFVEVSGSMNGFFRANYPTQFKTDLWKVMSYYSGISGSVNILTDDGTSGASIQQQDFRTLMNTGAFNSQASTKLPLMLATIISALKADSMNNVAVLVSDMKYSPVGAAAPQVLLEQYSSDINRLVGGTDLGYCLVGATSDFLDKSGTVITERSPYYYLIIGQPECVASVRNDISTLLSFQGHFVDNLESGFNYGAPKYSFGGTNKCSQVEDYPTFGEYEDEEPGDTCSIKLKVKLEDYRWIMADSMRVRNAFKARALHGTKLSVGNIKVEVGDIEPTAKELKRSATAEIELKVYAMPQDADVIEWTLDLPDTDYTLFTEFFDNATEEGDPTKSYSVLNFVKGIFQGGVVSKTLPNNYILISREY